MSKSNSAPIILAAILMNVFTLSAQAQMVGMVVHPYNGRSAAPVRFESQPRYGASVSYTHRSPSPGFRPGEYPHDDRNSGPQSRVTVHVYPGAHPLNPNNRYGNDGRVFVRPPMTGERLDIFVAQMVIAHAQALSCERLGEILRRLANDMLAAAQLPATPTEAERRGGDHNQLLRLRRERALHDTMRHPDFLKTLLSRLTESFKSCDKQCFDDGVAVGIISGTGYCNGAIAVSGLPDDGFKSQDHLPVCGTETFLGCQQGYTQAANTVTGCLEYASGANLAAFDQSISQDCHIDQP